MIKPTLFAALATLTMLSTSAQAAWDKVLVCESGNIWVDVNTDKRTELQLVSIDTQANNYLTGIGSYYVFLSGNQLGWRGTQNAGVFSPQDFQGASYGADFSWGNRTASKVGGEYVTGYETYTSFFRDGDDGLKVQVTLRNVSRCIDNAYNGKFGTCTKGTEHVDYEYKGDWFFRGCHAP